MSLSFYNKWNKLQPSILLGDWTYEFIIKERLKGNHIEDTNFSHLFQIIKMTKDLVSMDTCIQSYIFKRRPLTSVLNQTYTKFELIIVNDKSPENIEEIISTYNDKRIRYYKMRTI